MDRKTIERLLRRVRSGRVPVPDAVRSLQHLPFEDIGFAKADTHRALRCGFPEVIFGPGKRAAEVEAIAERLLSHGATKLLVTRTVPAVFDRLAGRWPQAVWHDRCLAVSIRLDRPPRRLDGPVLVVSAGTADIPVAEEAAVTASLLDCRVETLFDVGVAGIHRLLGNVSRLRDAKVLVVVAGMEGALASVVGGLVDRPVVAVPTSAGYGASFRGIAPLLTMLNSCAAGVTVVNIDNGFGAGYFAALACRPFERNGAARARPAGRPARGRRKRRGTT